MKVRMITNEIRRIHATNIDSLKGTVLLDSIELYEFSKTKGCKENVVREVQKLFEVQ